MNTTIFWRLAWKEYRQQRDLLVAIVLITFVILAIMLAWSWVENHDLSPSMAYHVALMMPVFYALGCGATLFSGEHERETFAFLRALPLRSGAAFWPKSAVALLSTVLLTAALFLMAALFTRGRRIEQSSDVFMLVHYLLIMAEVLAWTMLFSLLLKHPFWAIAAGGMAYFATLIAIMTLPLSMLHNQDIEFSVFVGIRCAILLALALVNVRLGSTWLERDRVLTTSLAGPMAEDMAPPPGPATRWTMLRRLWWQSLRESGWITATIYGVLVLLSVMVALEQGPIALAWGCLPALIGSLTFFQDHWKQRYRFFSEHGVAPRTLWSARILAGIAVCFPWLVVAAVTTATHTGNVGHFGSNPFLHWPGDLLVMGVITFAWGQWCSLVFRAGVVGMFVGVATNIVLVFAVSILRALGIPDWLGVYIPAAVFLWASWWRAPAWLAERNSWRQWFTYAGTLAVPLVLFLAGIAAHRAYEIPQLVDNTRFVSGPGNVNIPAGIAAQHSAALAELQRPATTEALETARLYRALWNELRQLPPPNSGSGMAAGGMMGGAAGSAAPEGSELPGSAIGPPAEAQPIEVDKEWEEKLAQLVERFVEISRRPDADFFPAPFTQFAQVMEGSLEYEFEKAAVADARRLDDAKEYDQALERYLALIRFARHYQQRGDAVRIGASVRLLSRVYEQLLTRAVRIEQSQESLLAMSKALNAPPYNFSPDYEVAWLREYAWRRGLVELDPSAWEVLATLNEAQYLQRMLAYLPWERARAARLVDYTSVVSPVDASASSKLWQWHQNTVGGIAVGVQYDPRGSLQALLKIQRAAFQVRLLLLAYKAEHGELPESLEELEQEFPGQVQPDPTNQQPWVYRPHGVPEKADLQRAFIWLPGAPKPGPHPNPSGTDIDFDQSGEVFFVEPIAAN